MKVFKTNLRKQMKTRLEQLSDEKRVKYTGQLAEQLSNLVEWQQAKTIGITISIPPEISTYSIIELAWQEGKKVAVPKCYPKEKTMEFKFISSFDQLESVYSGLLEPVNGTETTAVNEMDLIIVPGLAFTKEGHRLGFGGGYYDRFLTTYKGNTLALAFPFQLVDDLPMEMHDIPVQKIITPDHVYRT